MSVNTQTEFLFDQLEDLIQQLSDEQYSSNLDILFGASIGKHYRHIIEFFQCVATARDSASICYDARIRNTAIENNRELALGILQELRQQLQTIDDKKQLVLLSNITLIKGGEEKAVTTSLLREFHYAAEHAIHHMAILKMGLLIAFPMVKIPHEFGIAPSTIRYQKELAAS